MLGIGLIVDPGEDDEVQLAAGDTVVQAQSGEPVTLSAIIAETTSTLLAADTVPETTTTEAPTTTVAPSTTEAPAETITTAAPTTAAPTTAAPSTAPPATTATAPAPAPTTTTAAPPPPTTAPPTTAPPTTQADGAYEYGDPRGLQVWLDLAQCESHGNWSINTGNGYYGGLQFSLSAWQGVGGTGYPHEHPRDTQIEMGRRLQAQYGWGAWPHCSSKLGLR